MAVAESRIEAVAEEEEAKAESEDKGTESEPETEEESGDGEYWVDEDDRTRMDAGVAWLLAMPKSAKVTRPLLLVNFMIIYLFVGLVILLFAVYWYFYYFSAAYGDAVGQLSLISAARAVKDVIEPAGRSFTIAMQEAARAGARENRAWVTAKDIRRDLAVPFLHPQLRMAFLASTLAKQGVQVVRPCGTQGFESSRDRRAGTVGERVSSIPDEDPLMAALQTYFFVGSLVLWLMLALLMAFHMMGQIPERRKQLRQLLTCCAPRKRKIQYYPEDDSVPVYLRGLEIPPPPPGKLRLCALKIFGCIPCCRRRLDPDREDSPRSPRDSARTKESARSKGSRSSGTSDAFTLFSWADPASEASFPFHLCLAVSIAPVAVLLTQAQPLVSRGLTPPPVFDPPVMDKALDLRQDGVVTGCGGPLLSYVFNGIENPTCYSDDWRDCRLARAPMNVSALGREKWVADVMSYAKKKRRCSVPGQEVICQQEETGTRWVLPPMPKLGGEVNFIHRSSGVSKTFEWLPVVSFTAAVMATDLDFSGALTGAVDEETEDFREYVVGKAVVDIAPLSSALRHALPSGWSAYLFMPDGTMLSSTLPRDQIETNADGSFKMPKIGSPRIQARPGLAGITDVADFASYTSATVRAQKIKVSEAGDEVVLIVVGSAASGQDYVLIALALLAVALAVLPAPLIYSLLRAYVWLASMQSDDVKKADELLEIAGRNVNRLSITMGAEPGEAGMSRSSALNALNSSGGGGGTARDDDARGSRRASTLLGAFAQSTGLASDAEVGRVDRRRERRANLVQLAKEKMEAERKERAAKKGRRASLNKSMMLSGRGSLGMLSNRSGSSNENSLSQRRSFGR